MMMTDLTGNETNEELIEIIEDLGNQIERLRDKVDELTPPWGSSIESMEERLEMAADLAVAAGLCFPTPASRAKWMREGR